MLKITSELLDKVVIESATMFKKASPLKKVQARAPLCVCVLCCKRKHLSVYLQANWQISQLLRN